MNRIIYLPLEPYEERYTLQLKEWNESRFKDRDIEFLSIEGDTLSDDKDIKTGQVLDAHGRSYYALTQTAKLVKLMQEGEITCDDVIFSEDMFAPGYEALPYILEQTDPKFKPKIFTRCLAQSIDPDDFVFPWRNWMRHYELLVDKTVDGILIASTEMGWHLRMAMFETPIYVTGLPFDKYEVRSRVETIKPLKKRRQRIIFSSRFDTEKQPDFFMDLVERLKASHLQDIEVAILTGSKKLRSTDQAALDRAHNLKDRGLLKIYEGLKKSEYYNILSNSVLQFNCARQDWVSNTLNEASALGTLSLCPAFRSFPEALNNSEKHLYSPWSQDDAWHKMKYLLESLDDTEVKYAADTQHKSIDKTIDILTGFGSAWQYKK